LSEFAVASGFSVLWSLTPIGMTTFCIISGELWSSSGCKTALSSRQSIGLCDFKNTQVGKLEEFRRESRRESWPPEEHVILHRTKNQKRNQDPRTPTLMPRSPLILSIFNCCLLHLPRMFPAIVTSKIRQVSSLLRPSAKLASLWLAPSSDVSH
jgi:hypothetical protein